MSAIETFRIIATEFSYLSDDVVTKRLALTSREITNPKLAEDIKEEMIAYLTAHYLTISEKRKGAGGEVASVSEGKLSISYMAGYSNVKSDLAVTSYGRIYDRLMRSYTITPTTRVSNIFV
jgi:hypothetical protein